MVEHEPQEPLSEEENGEHSRSSLMARMRANAEAWIFPEIRDVLAQREAQSDESKPHIDVPGFTHVDHAVEQVLRFEDPEVDSVRIHSTLLQTPSPIQATAETGTVFKGPMHVTDEPVQMRIDHIFALVGAMRGTIDTPTEEQPVRTHETPTNLASNVVIIEERSLRTVALTIKRKSISRAS